MGVLFLYLEMQESESPRHHSIGPHLVGQDHSQRRPCILCGRLFLHKQSPGPYKTQNLTLHAPSPPPPTENKPDQGYRLDLGLLKYEMKQWCSRHLLRLGCTPRAQRGSRWTRACTKEGGRSQLLPVVRWQTAPPDLFFRTSCSSCLKTDTVWVARWGEPIFKKPPASDSDKRLFEISSRMDSKLL